MLSALVEGWRFGIAFSPVFSIVGSALCAALLARFPGTARRVFAYATLACSWLLGDGIRAIGQARGVYDSHSTSAVQWTMIVVWVFVGFLVGYVLPAWAGTFVGRRVTFGTGWISAAVIAGSVSTALAAIAGVL